MIPNAHSAAAVAGARMRHSRLGVGVGVGLLFGASCALADTPEPPLVPRPAALSWQSGELPRERIDSVASSDFAPAAELLARFTQTLCGHRLRLEEAGAPASITLHRSAGFEGQPEAYRLRISTDGMALEASNLAGMRNAALTAAQLICWQSPAALPALQIDDHPQFEWRGAMLDSARHFQSVAYIKRFLDAMALHKLNVFHWHLTDDQAWRIEIKRYPRLTEVGAWRVPAGAGQRDLDPATGEAKRYGGWYSQEQIREVIAYAADLGIQVVPEIDMPGHASAAIAAYPELSALPGSINQLPADWGIYPNLFTLEDHGFEFLQHVLDEVADLFPSPYLHVGGDEVQPDQWLQSARGKALLAELPGDDPHRLQAWYTQRIARYVASKGKRLIGWDEILTPALSKNAVVMSWRGTEGGIAAAQMGHDAVLSPWPTLYFDNQQSKAVDEPPGRLRTINLATVYAFDPLPAALTTEQRRRILGLQGNLWTEHIRTEARVSHMGFPRLAAVAELGWTRSDRREFDSFQRRMAGFWANYAAVGIEAADSLFAVTADIEPIAGALQASLHTQTTIGEIRYTLDGSTPTHRSAVYQSPLTVTEASQLKAQRFYQAHALGEPRNYVLNPTLPLRRSSRELALCSEDIALGLEDDAPPMGHRALFALDIQNPCWRWPQADLRRPMRLRVRVGQVPFNFQISAARDKIQFPKPHYQGGELQVYAPGCEGKPVALLPLGSAARSDELSTLAPVDLPVVDATDLCFRFAQPALEPMWAIDQVQLEPR